MQIMTGCERLQAEKCFRMLYFPFSHLTCLHTHNCLRRNKTCFLGWPPCLDIAGIPLYGRLGISNVEFCSGRRRSARVNSPDEDLCALQNPPFIRSYFSSPKALWRRKAWIAVRYSVISGPVSL